MSWAILGLTAGFILVAALLYFVLLKSQVAVAVKFIAVLVVTVFYWIQYQSLQQFSGWPSTDDLPDEFLLIASDVHEPNKKTGEQGIMYWWVRDTDNPENPPRVFELPFEADMHKTTDKVIEEQKKGSVYVGRKEETGSSASGLGVSFEKISKASRHKKQ